MYELGVCFGVLRAYSPIRYLPVVLLSLYVVHRIFWETKENKYTFTVISKGFDWNCFCYSMYVVKLKTLYGRLYRFLLKNWFRVQFPALRRVFSIVKLSHDMYGPDVSVLIAHVLSCVVYGGCPCILLIRGQGMPSNCIRYPISGP